jgi:hypothetical protein
MKKATCFLIISFVLLFLAAPVSAQGSAVEKDVRFTIKTNPLSALGGPLFIAWVVPLTAEYKVYFEAKTSEKQSIQLGLGYLGSSPLVTSIADLSSDTSIVSTGFHGQVWYKFFLTSGKALDGFYIGPHLSYASAKIKNNKENDKYFTVSKLDINCVFGYQIITKGGFALDLFTGLGLKNKKFDNTGFGEEGTSFSDWKLNNRTTISVPVGFSFGYAF